MPKDTKPKDSDGIGSARMRWRAAKDRYTNEYLFQKGEYTVRPAQLSSLRIPGLLNPVCYPELGEQGQKGKQTNAVFEWFSLPSSTLQAIGWDLEAVSFTGKPLCHSLARRE